MHLSFGHVASGSGVDVGYAGNVVVIERERLKVHWAELSALNSGVGYVARSA